AAFAAAYYHLAGNATEENRVTEALLKAANVDRLKQNLPVERPADPFEAPRSNIGMNNLWTAAETLLVNERIEDSLPILRRTHPRFAHAIYCRQYRHREALDSVNIATDTVLDRAWFDKLPTSSGDPSEQQQVRFSLAAQVARQLRELGRIEQVNQVVE